MKYLKIPNNLLGQKRRNKGFALLLMVFAFSAVILLTIAYTIKMRSEATFWQTNRIVKDQLYYITEGGLSQGLSYLSALNNIGQLPTGNTVLPSNYQASVANAESYRVDIIPHSNDTFTIAATAQSNNPRLGDVFWRTQMDFQPESFSQYEVFVDISEIAGSNWIAYYGFQQAILGPFHSNGGMNFFPNFWACGSVSPAAIGGAPRTFHYLWNSSVGISDDIGDACVPASNFAANYINNNTFGEYKYVNIFTGPYGEFQYQPKFYNGLNVGVPRIDLPALSNDARTQLIRDNAGLVLPNDYPGYVAPYTAYSRSLGGPKFVVSLADPASSSNGDGQVRIKQYLGDTNNDGSLDYGAEITRNISDINSAMVVYGDVMSLQGVVDGRLSIGVFEDVGNPNSNYRYSNLTTGDVRITGDIQYESRLDYQSTYGETFHYSDWPDLYTSGGSDINLSYINNLKTQVTRLDDILGVVAEKNILVAERDLNGNLVGASSTYNTPIYLDIVALATGKATPNDHSYTYTVGGETFYGDTDGVYKPENMQNRAKGKAYRFGGMIAHKKHDWDYWVGTQHRNGFIGPTLFDFRTTTSAGAPPFLPTTGRLLSVANSWGTKRVSSLSDTIQSAAH